mmetsp:Transcript_16956/g.44887  ORF Transcript_16956/g.44887 Transcript_16956/m.44887 type:complete len:158 (-) Transcript_16956:404-877(-)
MATARAALSGLLLALRAGEASALLVGSSGLPGLDELEEPPGVELLAAEPAELLEGGVAGVARPVNETGSGGVALLGCGACGGARGAGALPGLGELEEASEEEEELAAEPRGQAGRPFPEARTGRGPDEEVEEVLAEELATSLRSWTATPFQQVRARP